MSLTPLQVIDLFIQNVSALNEGDFGDFKRKTGLYLTHLKNGLQTESADVKRTLYELESLLLYKPDFNVSGTQARVLEKARLLRGRFSGSREAV